jgi:phospholipase A-2-activating protein
MMTGAMDLRNRLFNLHAESGKYEFDKEVQYHQGYVYSVSPAQDGISFFSSGKDGMVYRIDLQGNPVMELQAHDAAVNCVLHQSEHELVTGSWDGTAKVWDLRTNEVAYTLEGHAYATSAIGFENGVVVTGSQDKALRFWLHGKLEKTVENAHADIIRDFASLPGIGFASCSNDYKIKTWTIDAKALDTLSGHTSFIFGLTSIPATNELISASEDKTVRVWLGTECTQIINFPGTIWAVCVNHLGDLVTGCEDYVLRTFTRDLSRIAPEEEMDVFSKQVLAAESGSQIDIDKLPSIADMAKYQGKKDGDVRIFKNGTNPELYKWVLASRDWEKVGDVQMGGGDIQANANTKMYEGDRVFPAMEYDHVFDVDLGDNIMRKLPFNNGGNAHDSADRFVSREGLSKAMNQQIVDFLKTNALGYVTKDDALRKKPGQEMAAGAGAMEKKKISIIPMVSFPCLTFLETKPVL